MLISSHGKHAHSTLQWTILRGAKRDSGHTRFSVINYSSSAYLPVFHFEVWSLMAQRNLSWCDLNEPSKNYAEWKFLVTVKPKETVTIWAKGAGHCHCAIWGLKELALHKSLKPNFLPMERWLESMPRLLWGGTCTGSTNWTQWATKTVEEWVGERRGKEKNNKK